MSESVHATAVRVGEAGVLIRGASGSGKSSLALSLIGGGASLVADDRVHLSACHGRIVATCPASIAGRIELRGRGVVAVAHEQNVVIRLIVDIVPGAALERMPEPEALLSDLLGVVLPRQLVPDDLARALLLVDAALAQCHRNAI